jgi:phthiocerol/phenolphthiocerol synthesis type-I polyketide synthase D
VTIPTTSAQLGEWLAAEIGRVCGVPDVEVDRPLQEYGLTSREAVQLVGALEDLLDVELPDALVWEHPTIAALADALLGEPAEDRAADDAVAADEPIAVIGIGCRLPGRIRGPQQLWRLLSEGGSAIGEVPPARWEHFGQDSAEQAARLAGTTRWGGFLQQIAAFDAEFFGIAPCEAVAMDPQQRLVLEVAWEALEHAGLAPDRLRGRRAGVFVGISGNEYSHLTLADVSRIGAWTGTGSALSVAANRLSYVLDLRGPSIAVDSACSSSLVAVHLAMQSLRSGESEIALAAGTNLLLGPGVTVSFDEMGVMSPDGRCKAFDAAADGIARAEGAAVVVLKPLATAIRDDDRVLAVLRGSAVNSDGRSNGLTAPNPDAQQDLLRRAYACAGIDPADVDYVEAHGTGTPLGDPIEASALGAVLGRGRPADRPLLIGSVKTNLGHLEAAAGITGLIKVVLAMVNRRLPASLHFTDPNPNIPFDDLRLAMVAEQQPWPSRGRPVTAGVSGFGFGGTNAHVVVEQAPVADRPSAALGRPGQFVLGAPSEARLRTMAGQLAEWLTGPGEHADLADVEHTLARRVSGRRRAVATAGTRADLMSRLRSLAAGIAVPGVAIDARGTRGPVWVFSGHGSQWAGMGRRLLIDEPAFAAAVDDVGRAGIPLRTVLESGTEPARFEDLQPVLFGLQVALARLWHHHGARPAAVIGHSLGEVAAAVVAGAVSLADGVRIVTTRSRLLATRAGTGAMALLELSASEVSAVLVDHPDVEVALFNAPGQTGVAGPSEQVQALTAAVARRGLMARLVKSTVPGHCRLVEPITTALRDALSDVDAVQPSIPMYLAAAAQPRAAITMDADYWVANVRNPVRFSQAVQAAAEDGFGTFMEISPHPVLVHAISEIAPTASVLGTLRRADDETFEFHAGLGALIATGAEPPAGGGRLVDLPTTPWLRTEHWAPPVARTAGAGMHPLLGVHLELPDEQTHVWRADLGTLTQPWLADHRVDGRAILSGACFVEMAFGAASTVLGCPPEGLGLAGLTLHEPLPLTEHTEVTTTLRQEEVRFHSRASDGRWTLHCSATVTAAIGTEWQPAGQARAYEPPAELYQQLRSLGIQYGPAFRGVTGVWRGESSAVVTVAVPDATPRAGYLLHPALVDACLQGFVAAVRQPEPDVLYLPVELGAVRLLGDPSVGVRAHVDVKPTTGGMLGELRLVDAGGRVVLEITEVFVRRVPRSAVAAPLRDKLLARAWQQLDPAGGARSGRVLLAASPQHPLAARALAALSALGVPAEIVSADDPEVLAHDRPSAVAVLVEPGPPDGLRTGRLAVWAGARWARAMAALPGEPPRLWLVTSSAATVLDADHGLPGPASVRGLVRVLAYEHPTLRASWLDLDAADPTRAVDDLAGELSAGSAEDEVAWRAGRRYVGRLVRARAPEPANVPITRADGGYVITGGLGGLGLLLAGWLADQGAGKLVLNGRGAPSPEAGAAIEELRDAGTEVEVVLGDISAPGTAERLIAAAGDVRGIAHAAALFADRTVSLLDEETLERTWLPKAHGAWRLHEASLGRDLDWWLGFSSAAALHGLPGQPAYASANAYLDAIVALRRAQGLPAATINWGTWAEVGAAAGLRLPWMHPIMPSEGVELIARVLAAGGGAFGAVRLKPAQLVAAFPALARVPLLADLLGEHAGAQSSDWPGIDLVRGEPDARRLVSEQLRLRVTSVMGLHADALADEPPLIALGLDSLLAVRICNALQHDFAINLHVSVLLRGASLGELHACVCTELAIADGPGTPAPGPPHPLLVSPRDAAERLVAGAWQEVVGEADGVTHEFGGDAAQSERIATLINDRTGHDLTTRTLFRQPTIELMAGVVRAADRSTGAVRVLREGPESPLLLFHPGGGDTGVYRQLVELIGLPAYGFDRVEGTDTVEQRVARLMPELRRLRPDGPYRLAGWSFGGFLAFEAAQQLTAAGESVELLALIDPILPLPEPTGVPEIELLRRRFHRFEEFLQTSYGARVKLPLARLARLDDEAQAELLVATILAADVVDRRVSTAILAHQRRSFLDARLLERYRPARYAGSVVFYSSESPVPGGLRDPRFDRSDAARGWDAVCPNLEIVTVSGHHLSLLDPPHVTVIARHLADVLTRTFAARGQCAERARACPAAAP